MEETPEVTSPGSNWTGASMSLHQCTKCAMPIRSLEGESSGSDLGGMLEYQVPPRRNGLGQFRPVNHHAVMYPLCLIALHGYLRCGLSPRDATRMKMRWKKLTQILA